jgi:hypothetical protein
MWADQLDPAEQIEARELFEREALLLAGLSHPALPHVADYFSENGRQYLVMELIEGETLDARILSQGPVEVGQALRWGLQLCDVLRYLHERPQPIIFRDVKPPNIMVNGNGAVKVIDFGIARIYAAGKAQDTVAFGTPGYAAPEQYGKAQSDPRVDIYGLGATLHFLLTGLDPADHPFRFDPPSRTRAAVPPDLDDLVLKAVAVEPDQRWASMREMEQALERLESSPPTSGVGKGAKTAELPPLPPSPPDPLSAPGPVARPAPRGAAVPSLPASSPGNGRSLASLPPPSKVAPRFETSSFAFGTVRRGETRRVNVRILGEVDGVLASSERRWLRAEPHRVRGRDPVVQLVAYSGPLREGREHHAIVTLKARGGQVQLPVTVEVAPSRVTLGSVLVAALLTAATLIPAIGLAAALLFAFQYFSCPLDERPALRPFALATGFFALCNALVVTVAVFALRMFPSWMHWLRGWW